MAAGIKNRKWRIENLVDLLDKPATHEKAGSN